MFTKVNFRKISTGLVALTLLVSSSLSYADWGMGINFGGGDHHDDWRDRHDDHHFYRYHEHPQFGLHLSYIPDGYYTVWVGGTRYFYYDGLYYVRVEGGYMLVAPPIGAYVSTIPPDFQPVVINGVTYYADNGVYYVLTRHHGYKVVAQPVVYVPRAPVVVTQPAVTVVTTQAAPIVPAGPVVSEMQDSFTVNIPNDKGGYTAIVIKRSGNGYVGPQGEFYAKFPKVSQLKVMYGK